MLAMGLSVTCLSVSFFRRFMVAPIGMFYSFILDIAHLPI